MDAETSVLTISPHPSHEGKLRLSEISILPSHLTPASVLSFRNHTVFSPKSKTSQCSGKFILGRPSFSVLAPLQEKEELAKEGRAAGFLIYRYFCCKAPQK